MGACLITQPLGLIIEEERVLYHIKGALTLLI